MPGLGQSSRTTRNGHGIERVFERLACCGRLRLHRSGRGERGAQAGLARPACCCGGACSSRATWSCARAWGRSWQCGALRPVQNRLAWRPHKTQARTRVFPEMNLGNEPPWAFAARALSRGLGAARLACRRSNEISVMTHFSDARWPKGIAAQSRRLRRGYAAGLAHERCICNSGCLAALPGPCRPPSAVTGMRAGIMLYGGAPDYPERSADDWGLQPTMTLSHPGDRCAQLQTGDKRGLRLPPSLPSSPMRIASWPAAMPMAIRATAAPAQPVPGGLASAAAWWAGGSEVTPVGAGPAMEAVLHSTRWRRPAGTGGL
ncbi:hypothetical protein FQR65_LT20851 [Abscondita terminalis]|nr:hypothetical protein FQR65_LT20851 [Abscondita terminalis]